MPGGVRVESGVECAEAYAEQHGADDHHPHRRGEGLGAQGERDEQGGRGRQRAGRNTQAPGQGAGDDRGGDPGHQQDPQRPDRLAEAESHRGPQQAEGGTGQGDAQVRQAGEQHGRHGENFLVRVVRTGSPCRESEQHAMTDGFLASARAGLPGHLSSSKVYIA